MHLVRRTALGRTRRIAACSISFATCSASFHARRRAGAPADCTLHTRALLRIDPESGERKVFAAGLRNTIGFDRHPPTRRLFGMDHNTDWLGNERPLEELNEIVEDGRYGWPFLYCDGEELQLMPHREPYFVSQELWREVSRKPLLGYTAHSAPMETVFYSGRMFPEEYVNDAFVAMRGSWNRNPASGYEVVRVRFAEDGTPRNIEPFVKGFLLADKRSEKDPRTPVHIARPVGLAVWNDGSLLVTDDSNDAIYRITYGETTARAAPQRLAGDLFAKAPASIRVQSPAIDADGMIGFRQSDYGEGVSRPIHWSGIPEETRSLVLMMEDPQATSPLPFVHWLIADIPPANEGLPEDVATAHRPDRTGGARQGSNSQSKVGYMGPRTPPGEGVHHYHFQVFALDRKLELPEGFNRKALLDAMAGHVIARGELVGRFAKTKPEKGIDPTQEEQALLEVPGWSKKGNAPKSSSVPRLRPGPLTPGSASLPGGKARHGCGERHDRRQQQCFQLQVLSYPLHVGRRRCERAIGLQCLSPPQKRERRHDRQQPDQNERDHLRPEPAVTEIVRVTLDPEHDPRDAGDYDEDRHGSKGGIDPRDDRHAIRIHPDAHHGELRREQGDEREHEDVVQDGEPKIGRHITSACEICGDID